MFLIRRTIQWVSTTLATRTFVRAAFTNSIWLIADKAIRLIGGLLVGIWVARYLTPHNFGIFSTLLAINGLGITLAGMGFDTIIVRYFIKYPNHESEIFGTTFVLRFIGCTVIGILIASIPIFALQTQFAPKLWALMGLTVVATSISNVKQWFESKVQAKYIIVAELVAFGLATLCKIWGVLHHYTVDWFIIITLLELILAMGGYWILYQRHKIPRRITFRWRIARLLLKRSFPMLLTSATVLVYWRIDQILIQSISGETEAGLYAAATRISEITYAVPVIMLSSLLPGLTKLKHVNPIQYQQKLQILISLSTLIAYFFAIVTTICSPFIIFVLYGSTYMATASILAVHIWSIIWISQSSIGYIYILNSKLTTYALAKDFMAACTNLGLNFLLIPSLGGIGAAIATVVAYSIAGFWGNLFFKKLRPLFKMQLKGLGLFGLFDKFKLIFHKNPL